MCLLDPSIPPSLLCSLSRIRFVPAPAPFLFPSPPSHTSLTHLLSSPQRTWPLALALALSGSAAWGAFYLYAANQERLSSSVFKQLLTTVRDSPALADALGDAIRPEPVWWMNGDPVVNGAVSVFFASGIVVAVRVWVRC